jgi:hypothetical protein
MQQGANKANIPATTAAKTDPPKNRLLSIGHYSALAPESPEVEGPSSISFLLTTTGLLSTSMASSAEAHLKPT